MGELAAHPGAMVVDRVLPAPTADEDGVRRRVHRPCPLCRGDNADGALHRLSQDPWRLKSCAGCGLVYLENPPGYDELETEHEWRRLFRATRERRDRSKARQAASDFLKIPNRLARGKSPRRKDARFAWRHIAGARILDVGWNL